MKLEAGKVFSIEKENQPLKGCTVSKELEGGRNPILIFSMDRNTDISPERFMGEKPKSCRIPRSFHKGSPFSARWMSR